MSKEQEKLVELYMKLTKRELAEMLAIITTTQNKYPTPIPMQDGLYPPPYELPPHRPIEVWYTTKTNDAIPRYQSNIS